MKITLIRFAKDFTKLSDYFGPDDYDRNLNMENNNVSPSRSAFKKDEKIFEDKEEKNNNNKSKIKEK